MGANELNRSSNLDGLTAAARPRGPFNSIKAFVCCHSLLQLSQLVVSGCMKSSISTIERRYGFSSRKAGMLVSFNEVGNTVLIVFVSFLGSRVHRPRFIGGGALLACLASLLMAVPHFLGGTYDYTGRIASGDNSSGICLSSTALSSPSSNQTCLEHESTAQQVVYPLLVMGQLLLGVAAVPIQPFGISYIDDYSSRKNSPLYLGILLAMTSIGPAFGFIVGSFTLRYYVDFDKLTPDQIELDSKDLRWVGAWWLGFLVASCLLFLTALPYFFFPRSLPKEDGDEDMESSEGFKQQQQTDPLQELSLLQFLKSFPQIALRTLRSPVYLLVVLAQVNLAALLSGLATFMAKFIERQFSQTVALSTAMIGGVGIPLAVLGTVLGGALMRRFNISVFGASKLCTASILLCMFSALPLLLIGCSTQTVAGVFPPGSVATDTTCSSGCGCPAEAFNPVCGSDGVEFRSPCHAGCSSVDTENGKVINYTSCLCVDGGSGFALPKTCGSGCSHLLPAFMVLLALTSFIASFSQTPSYIIILRTVPSEDKSFAVGVQYMLFRVLAFLPGPVLYGSVIDTTCILWGRKCGRQTSCHYYNLDSFRQRFLGLQAVFVCGGLLCFLLTMFVLRRMTNGGPQEPQEASSKGGYELVRGQKTESDALSTEKDVKT